MADAINPAHYRGIFSLKEFETIDVTRQLCFCLGNYYKYLARLYKKDSPVQDFRKARWYMEDFCRHAEHKGPESDSMCSHVVNPSAEKARIAFDLILPPDSGVNQELYDRYVLLSIVADTYISPVLWREQLDAYENKYLKGVNP